MTVTIIKEDHKASAANGLQKGYTLISARYGDRMVALQTTRLDNPKTQSLVESFREAAKGMTVLFNNARRSGVDFYTLAIDGKTQGYNATREDDMDRFDEDVRNLLKSRAKALQEAPRKVAA